MEDKVDQKIDSIKASMKDAMWSIAKDIGWSALTQIGEVVSFVQNSASSFAEGAEARKGGVGDGDGNGAGGLRMKKNHSTESLLSRKPSHSVMEGMASFSSVEAISDVVEKEAYIADFISMMKEGLYVFASHYVESEEEGSDVDNSSAKRFRLRVFFYESDDEGTDALHQSSHHGHNPEPYFVLHPVDNNAANLHDDIEIIPVDEVMDIVLSGTNAIKFIGTNERIITELVLSNREDCDTLFQGMKFCFNGFNSNITKRISSTESLSNNIDISTRGSTESNGDSSLPFSIPSKDGDLIELNSNPNLINDGGVTFDNPVALSEVDRGGGESSDSVESDEGESESVENNGEIEDQNSTSRSSNSDDVEECDISLRSNNLEQLSATPVDGDKIDEYAHKIDIGAQKILPPIDLTEDMHREIDDDSYDEESKINSGQTFESVALVVEDDESIDVECRR